MSNTKTELLEEIIIMHCHSIRTMSCMCNCTWVNAYTLTNSQLLQLYSFPWESCMELSYCNCTCNFCTQILLFLPIIICVSCVNDVILGFQGKQFGTSIAGIQSFLM